MTNLNGMISTSIIASDDLMHVYEITKEMSDSGDEAILLTLCPTITNPNLIDLTMMHMLNHMQDEGLNLAKIHFVYLFSTVMKSKMSSKGLKVDEENFAYLRNILVNNPNAKVIIAFGSSLEKCPAAIESKVQFFSILKELRPGEHLWELSSENMEGDAVHPLFAGIKYSSENWTLKSYIVPYKYTPTGYEEYLENKEQARERFIKNVLSKKVNVTENETDIIKRRGRKPKQTSEE